MNHGIKIIAKPVRNPEGRHCVSWDVLDDRENESSFPVFRRRFWFHPSILCPILSFIILKSFILFLLSNKVFPKYTESFAISLKPKTTLIAIRSSLLVFFENNIQDFSIFASCPDQLKYCSKHLLIALASFSLAFTHHQQIIRVQQLEAHYG